MIKPQDMAFLQVLSRELATGQIRLPSFPDAVMQIRQALEHEDCDVNRIAELASLETMLASRLLQTANSAYYNAAGNSVTDLNAAVMRLGLGEVRNMAIALAVEQIFIAKKHPAIARELGLLWRRSIGLSAVADVLAAACSAVPPEQAFLCGLLHEVGKLYMLTKTTEFPDVRVDLMARSDAPDTWHPQVGRCIVEAWGFDRQITETLDPVEYIREAVNAEADLVDVVYVAEMVCSATREQPIDFEHVSVTKLGLTEERLQQLKPRIAARRVALMQSMPG